MDFIRTVLSEMSVSHFIDIVIISYIFYKLYMLLKNTRAEQLVKGIGILLFVLKVSEFLKLNMLHYILQNTLNLGIIALLIIFQPELRRALEYIGRNKLLSKNTREEMEYERNKVASELVDAVARMSRAREGALIVMEREVGLNEYIATGTTVDSAISSDLIVNIFTPKAPLHDGATIIRDERIMAAACVLPLSQDMSVSRELGTRHRAAIGISEVSDAFVIVVSEETGSISIAESGSLQRFVSADKLGERLGEFYSSENVPFFSRNVMKWWFK